MSFASREVTSNNAGGGGGGSPLVRLYLVGTAATEVVPAGYTSCLCEVGGAGAAGNNADIDTGDVGGGGGGGYAAMLIAVVAANTFTYTVAPLTSGRTTLGTGSPGVASTISGTVAGGPISLSSGTAAGGVAGGGSAGGVASGGTTNTNGGAADNSGFGGVGAGPLGGKGGGTGTTPAILAGLKYGGGGGGRFHAGTNASGVGYQGYVQFTYYP